MPFNNILRFRNLFKPEEQFNQQGGIPPYQPEPRFDETIEAEIEPDPVSQGRGLDRLYEALGNAPQRGKVGTRGKIGSTLMALGGRSPEDIDATIHSKYHQAQDEYGNTIKPLIEGAKIESTRMNNDSLAESRRATAAASLMRANTGQANTESLIDTRAATAARADKALELKRALGDKPNTILRKSPGMKDQLIDKATGAVIAEYESGTLRPDEEEAMKQAGRLEVVAAQGANQRANTQLAGQNAINTKVAGASGAGQTPGQYSQQVKNRAQALLRMMPEFKEAITFDAQNGVTIDESLPPAVKDMITTYLNSGKTPSETGAMSIEQQNAPPVIPPASGVPMTGGGNTVNQSPIGGGGDKRARAIKALQKAGKATSENNIAVAMSRLK